jgi:hypothetical protein
MAEMMRLRYLIATVCVVLFGVGVAEVAAQEAARRIMVFFDAGPGVTRDAGEGRFLYESLLVALHRENPRTEFLAPTAGDPAGLDDAARGDLAREGSAEAWVDVTVESAGAGARYGVTVRSVFLYTGETLLDLYYEVPVVESERSLALRLWNRSARAVSEAYSTVSRESALLIRGAAGTDIVGLTATPLRLQSDELRVRLDQPAVYTFEAQSVRHYPQEVELFLGGRETEVILNQDERSRVLLSAYGQEFSYLGIDVTYMLVPPHVFVRGGFYTYRFGLVPFVDDEVNADEDGEAQLVVSQPLTNWRLLFGTYWNDPTGWVRLYSAAGPLARRISSSGFRGLEPIAPWGIEIVNGIELFPQRRLRVFFEHTPTVGIAAEPDFLRAQFFEYEGTDPIYFDNDAGYLDFASMRIGVRYQW